MSSNPPPEGFLSFEAANANRLKIAWDKNDLYQPKEKKLVVLKQIDIRDLEEYLDWNILFSFFEMTGRYPKILNDREIGSQATALLEDAKTELIKIKKDNLLQIDALFKVWKANGNNNTIRIEDNSLYFLRQQAEKKKVQPNYCLSDFIAPREIGTDYLGGYVVSVTPKTDEFKGDKMYEAIIRLLSDAARKYLHLKIRTEYWAYAKREKLSTEEILKHKYQGIIIPIGHAALPNQEGKATLNTLLNAESNLGRSLTTGAIGWHEFGLCFSHPESKYFGTGKLGVDQIDAFQTSIGLSSDSVEDQLGHLSL